MKTLLSLLFVLWCAAASAELYLVFDTALQLNAPNSGGLFAVDLELKEETVPIYHGSWGAVSGVWLPQAVNLDPWAGKTVTLQLKTSTVYSHLNCSFYGWGRPRIVRGDIARPEEWEILYDLTEMHRDGMGGRRWARSPGGDAEVRSDGLDISGSGYMEEINAGPESMPCLFGHPYYDSLGQSWAGYEFTLELPEDTGPAAAPPAEAPTSPEQPDEPVLLDWRCESLFGEASVNPRDRTLEVKLGEGGFGYAFAGCEFAGLRRLSGTLLTDRAYRGEGDNRMAGIVIDYYTGSHYGKRLWLVWWPDDLPTARWEMRAPVWHLRLDGLKRHEEYYREVEMIRLDTAYPNLDLASRAPEGWTGRVWIGVALQDAGPSAACSLKLR